MKILKTKTTTNNKKDKQKISLKALLRSPRFYLALFPHIIALSLVLINSLGYFYVFFIFYSELVIDYLVFIFGLLLTKEKHVQKIYKSKNNKLDIIVRALMAGLVFIIFLGMFSSSFLYLLTDKSTSIFDILNNNTVWLAIGIYLISKIISLVVNKYKYNTDQQPYIEKGMSLAINLVTLIIFVMPGILILMFLKFLPINIELIAIIILFVIRAYIDGGVAFQEKDIELFSKK